MSYKLRKNKHNLCGEMKLICTASKPHYFSVYLWNGKEAFLQNTIGNTEDVSGCCELTPTLTDPESGANLPSRKIGEIHFVKSEWSEEIVAHELCHALLHRLRVLCPSVRSVIGQEEEYEEDICYEFGAWMQKVYKWLWHLDQGDKWEIKKEAAL